MKTTENKELQNNYITVAQAKELCIEAHKGQWRKQKQVIRSDWGSYKTLGANIDGVSLVNWVDDDTFLVSEPYSAHPIAVAEMMNTDEEKIVAYLHDVFEDCDGWGLGRVMDNSRFYIINRNKLQEYNISERVHFALDSLTKEKHVPYKDYIQNIIDSYKYYTNSLPIKVKIADMFHNMSDNPSGRQKTKYAKGLKLLLGAL